MTSPDMVAMTGNDFDSLFIGSGWRTPHGRQTMTAHNPATGETVGTCPRADETDASVALCAARGVLDAGIWSASGYAYRAAILDKVADLLDDAGNAAYLTDLITAEMGSPISWARPRQVPHAAGIARYYAQLGRGLAEAEVRRVPGHDHRIVGQPVGVVVAILPWNMPIKTMMMKVAPAILAGCTIVVKPAPQTPLSALALAGVFKAAGIPAGVLSVLPGTDTLGQYLVRHEHVDKVAFTGSSTVGVDVAQACAAANRRYTLELGGKSPAIVLDASRLDDAIDSLRVETFGNSGQVCSAHTRLLVPGRLLDRAEDRVKALVRDLTVGDPRDPNTDVGPLVDDTQAVRVRGYIRRGVESTTAELLCGGYAFVDPDNGRYVLPTVFTNVDPADPLFQNEVFGPVLTITPYADDDHDHAAQLANDTVYGLEAAVWGDPVEAQMMAGRLRAGTVRVNGADPGLSAPLGGFKFSGVGRELGPEGLAPYRETQVVTL